MQAGFDVVDVSMLILHTHSAHSDMEQRLGTSAQERGPVLWLHLGLSSNL